MSTNFLDVNIEWMEDARLRVSAKGNNLFIDKLYEGGHKEAGFRPTELLMAGLGACTMGTVLAFCENMSIPVKKFSIHLRGKREPRPERLSEIRLSMTLEGNIPEDRIKTLRRVAKGCRVHYTLTHPPVIELDLRVNQRHVGANSD